VIVEIRDRKRLAMRPECVRTEFRIQRTGLGRVSAGVGNEAASARHLDRNHKPVTLSAEVRTLTQHTLVTWVR
jgi:hypothetical protein